MKNLVPATVTDAPGTASTPGINEGGVAVLDAPMAPAPVPGNAVPKPRKPRTRTPRKQPAGQIASAASRAAVLAAAGSPDALLKVTALDNAVGVNICDPTSMTHLERVFLRFAAQDVATGVGLGNRSGGFGPFVRTAVIGVIRLNHGKTGKQVLTREQITRDSIRAALTDAQFQTKAKDILKVHLAGLKHDASPEALKARKNNAALALRWIDAGLHASYVSAIDTLGALGGECDLGSGLKMPLNMALQISYGRSLTASVIHKSNAVAMGAAKAALDLAKAAASVAPSANATPAPAAV